MIRRAGLFVAFLCLTQTAEAALGPRKDLLPRPDAASIRSTPAAPKSATTGADGQFKLTADSDVLLNGKPCAYRDVPKDASVVRIEVAEDRKTILRIEFRLRK